MGTRKEIETEWVRLAREESLEAAKAYNAAGMALKRHVFDLLFPHGMHSPVLNADDIRAIADRMKNA